MRLYLAGLILIALAAAGRADEAVANAQRILKEQGFYYGEITGQKDTVTTDAVRRYQIRNGLQINGELNDETLRSLKSAASASAASTSAQPAAPSPAPQNADTSDLRDESPRGNATVRSEPVSPLA